LITIKGSHINRELEVTRIYELKKRQRVNMTDALNLDDEAWKTFLDGLKADDPDSNVTRENQWDFDFQWTGTEAGQWIDQQQMPDDTGNSDVNNAQVNPLSPPSYTTLASLEIKSATEPVPRLEAETQFRETSADDLNALVRQLQRE